MPTTVEHKAEHPNMSQSQSAGQSIDSTPMCSRKLPVPKPTGKPAKKKGSRSVSTMSAEQVARKRANDREAQRAIRARTKSTIANLEREVGELRRKCQVLQERNRELERRLSACTCRASHPAYPGPGFDMDGLPQAASPVSGPPPSVPTITPEYNGQAPFETSYLPTPEPCHSWPTVVPVSSTVAVPSGVSSPCSSVGPADDYVPAYIPTSVPSSMVEGSVLPGQSSPCLESKEYQNINAGHQQHYPSATITQTSSAYVPHQPWSLYPTASYFQ